MSKSFAVLILLLLLLSTVNVGAQVNKDSGISKLESHVLDPLFWKHESGLGPALSFGMTSFDGIPALNASFKIPFSKYFAFNLRPFYIPAISSDSGTVSLGGRLEFEVRTRPMFNFLRIYLAAGPQFFWGVHGDGKGEFDWSGGWELGIEVFYFPTGSVWFEVGTGGGTVVDAGSGPTIGTGFRFYPFRKKD